MENKVRIVADSACDVDIETIDRIELDFQRAPLTLELENTAYLDDDNLDIDKFLASMEKSKAPLKTAAPSPELFLERYKKEGSVFVVTLSNHLSASYANAMLAKQMYLDEIGNKFIHVFDSLGASIGETLVVLKISEFVKQNLDELEIVEKVNAFINSMNIYFVLEKYDNLVKNGRINPYVATLASLLSIRPICYGDKGKLSILDKARGTTRAMSKLIDRMIKDRPDDVENRTLAISHVKCLDKAIAFKEEVMKKIPFKDAIIVETGGLCSSYAERNGIIVSF